MSGITKEDKTRQLQMQNDYQKVFMRTAAGRRVLKDLLATTGIFELSFSGENRLTNYNEGRRSIGLEILTALDKNTYLGLKELEESDVTDTDYFSER